jgi:hypothetical protein
VTATVIPISTGRRFCFDYCRQYDCFIDDERIAQNCSEFETEKQVNTGQNRARRMHPSGQTRPTKINTDQVKAYIASLHSTLFGRSFMVTKPEGLDAAAEWIVEMFEAVQNHGS